MTILSEKILKALKDEKEKNQTVKAMDRQKKFVRSTRIECLQHYGGKCDCCGEGRAEFLAIDHIGGGGLRHKKEIGNQPIDQWLKKNKYPSGFRVLCHNCNMSLGFYGYCPHQESRNERMEEQADSKIDNKIQNVLANPNTILWVKLSLKELLLFDAMEAWKNSQLVADLMRQRMIQDQHNPKELPQK